MEMNKKNSSDKEQLASFAGKLFNDVWELLEKRSRTVEESEEMLNAAHTSLFYWKQIGKPKNFAAGYCQLSMVYSAVDEPDMALRFAQKCLRICERYELPESDFERSWAYEAIANAYAAKAKKLKPSVNGKKKPVEIEEIPEDEKHGKGIKDYYL